MKKYILTVAVLGLLGSACNSKLDVAPPNSITDEQINEVLDKNLKTIVKPMSDALPSMFWQGLPGGDFRISDLTSMHLWAMGIKSNDMVFEGSGDAYNQYVNIVEAQGESNPWNGNLWTWSYGHISGSVNSMLNLMSKVKEENLETEDEKLLASYKASGLAMKANLYLMLMQFWTDNYTEANASQLPGVPYYDTYNPYQEPRAREKASTIWTTVLTDINKAVKLFQAAGVGFTDTPDDIDLGVACMIWARAAYAAGQWDQVVAAVDLLESKYDNKFISQANYIGDRTTDTKFHFPQFTAFSRVDMAINPEVIFGVKVSNVLTGSYPGSNYPGWMNSIGDDCYGGSRLGFMSIDKRLYDKIEANDIRRQNFLSQPVHDYPFGTKSNVTDNIPMYANLKFAAKVSPGGGADAQYKQDIVVMRYSEAVLLKAEAQARLHQDGLAQATLTKLTTARGASAVTEGGDALMARIQLETRIEMWGEQGIEWLRNKRWGIGVDRSGTTNHTSATVVPAGKGFTWQIPLCETLYNHNIEQNPAY